MDGSNESSAERSRADGGSAAGRGLSRLVTRRPVAITMFMLAIAVFGVVSLKKLPIDLLPEISYPTLTVRTTYPGAAPEDVEDRISVRLQEALSTLPHLLRSISVSRAETSDVVLDFEWGTPMTFAVQDVRDKLDGVFLPNGAERPLILRYDPNLDPILRIAVSVPEQGAGRDGGAAPTAAGANGEPAASGADGAADGRAQWERELVHLRWIAENRVKRELETVPGVAAVLVRGGLEEEIRVRVDPFKMAAQNLDPALIATRLAQENLNASGGGIREGSTEYLVRTLNEFRDVEEIADLALVRRGDAVIRVRDVATVERTHAEREVVTRLSGREAVEIAIYREAGANIVGLAESVRARVFGTPAQKSFAAELEKQGGTAARATFEDQERVDYLAWQLRDEVRLEVLSDQSTFIKSAIEDVQSAAWMGALLAVVVIWFALRRLPATVIIAISIPISVVVTFAPMYLFGVSLNVMSLGGLALGIGMLVDNSIVVLESITRCRDEGDDLLTAAGRGTREVAGAITGSTLTTIAVFAPIVFVHGIAGRIFGDQALTVVTSLLVSLLVAVLVIPMLASRRWLAGGAGPRPEPARPAAPAAGLAPLSKPMGDGPLFAGRASLFGLGWVVRLAGFLFFAAGKLVGWVLWPLHRLHDLVWSAIESAYPRLLGAALRHAWVVVLVTGLLAAFAATRVRDLGLDLLPEIHQGEFTFHVGLPVGTPLESTDLVMRALEREVRAVDGVALTALTAGVEKDTLTREIEGKHTARLTVRLAEGLATAEAEERIVAAARARIAAHPAVRSIDLSRASPFAIEAPVQVEVLGHDLELLARTASEVERRLAQVQGLADVRTSVRAGHPEARVTFDRDKTLEYGLDLNAVSTLVRDQVLGNVSTRFTDGDDRIDVRVLGDEVVLGSLDRVLDLVVNPSSPRPVPLSAVARVETVEGPAEIRRIGNTRAAVVSAATTGLDLGGTSRAIERELASLVPPDGVTVQLGGQKRELDEAQASMRFALLLALFLVYAVMACQFESLVQPLIILTTVPLAAVGVVFTLELCRLPLSVIVFIGLILLAGIVVNNAIVLVDRVNQTRARGVGVREALVEAASTRLRPIYMTTATTVLGLLPMTGWLASLPGASVLGAGEGAELRAPLAITVISGLVCSTLLTLVVIPSVYQLVYARADRRPRSGGT